MGKVLFLVLIGVIAWLLFFAKRKIDVKRSAPPKSPAVEQMHLCARCGVHLPASEACEIANLRGKFSCADPDNCANRSR